MNKENNIKNLCFSREEKEKRESKKNIFKYFEVI